MSTPIVVLVHGAFAEAASFAPVTRRLLDTCLDVRVPPVSNRSLIGDAEYIRRFTEQLDGPVLLVGHSYGGAVITVAGVADNVVGLVYVAGYALQEGESLGELQGRFPDSELAANLVYEPYTRPDGTDGTDVSVRIDAFGAVFAAGVDPATVEVLARSQRPLAAIAFGEQAPVAAWRTRPSWGIVSSADQTINPDVERFGYRRAGVRRVVELDAPHLAMYARPDEVAQVVADAVEDVS